MKMFFNYENSQKELYFNNVISFHGNINNQCKLYDVLLEGLKGNDKTFQIDNQLVKKKELNIIEFSSNSILDDLKMTSKSFNYKILNNIVDSIEEKELLNDINILLSDYQAKVNSFYKEIEDDYELLINPSIEVRQLKNLIIDNFNFVSKENLNISYEIELQLLLILTYVKSNSESNYFLMIKHFDHCLDISQMKAIILKALNINNLNIFIFTKSFELYEYFLSKDIVSYMVNNDIINKLDIQFNESLELENLLTDKELMEITLLKNLYTRYNTYISIVSEKHLK